MEPEEKTTYTETEIQEHRYLGEEWRARSKEHRVLALLKPAHNHLNGGDRAEGRRLVLVAIEVLEGKR